MTEARRAIEVTSIADNGAAESLRGSLPKYTLTAHLAGEPCSYQWESD